MNWLCGRPKAPENSSIRCENVLKTFCPPNAGVAYSVRETLASGSTMYRPSRIGAPASRTKRGVEMVDTLAELAQQA